MTLGFPVIMFPEGRATDGSQVIPFKSSTFEAAVQAARPVLPVVLHYQDGNSPTVASWINEPFFNHFFRLIKNSRLEVTATILPPVAGFQDRRLLAGECHRVVSQEFEKGEPKS
jgi:1-acyl-sn-glycerol-3-phosphate acyltransferase